MEWTANEDGSPKNTGKTPIEIPKPAIRRDLLYIRRSIFYISL